MQLLRAAWLAICIMVSVTFVIRWMAAVAADAWSVRTVGMTVIVTVSAALAIYAMIKEPKRND